MRPKTQFSEVKINFNKSNFRFDYEERNRKKEAKENAAYEAFMKQQNQAS